MRQIRTIEWSLIASLFLIAVSLIVLAYIYWRS